LKKNDIKVILFSLSILLIILTTSFYVKNYLENSTKYLLSELYEVEQHINKNEWDIAYQKVLNLNKDWEKTENMWSLFINHHEIDSIAVSLKTANEYIKTKDKTQTLGALSSLKHYISHIPEMEYVNLKNIF
jgi:hypothetical protein